MCSLPNGEKYSVSIPLSDDSYDYDIPPDAPATFNLSLKFHVNDNTGVATVTSAVATVKLYNNPGVKEIRLVAANGFDETVPVVNDTPFIKLPINQQYSISIKGIEIKNNKIIVDNSEYNLLYYALYFTDKGHAELIPVRQNEAVVYIVYKNLLDKPVAGEAVFLKSKTTGKNYSILTASKGEGMAIVPRNEQYSLSLKHFANFADIDLSGSNDALVGNDIIIKYPGSAEYEAEKKRMKKIIETRDSTYKLFEGLRELKYKSLKEMLADTLPVVAAQLKKDPGYFEKKDNIVCAVLNRNDARWRSKMIVTDVTGSMYPYMEQVGLWHLLEMMNKKTSQYIFFNDGDNKPDAEKVIGRTGGIYPNLSGISDSIINTMTTAMRNGGGGDAPENDMEALLKAQQLRAGTTELILVADALSPVKDIELLESMHLPVRIILCGSRIAVNIDYLEIAYRTGGSVHTIEQDIFDLSRLHDGEVLKIGKLNYQLVRGKFFPVDTKL